MMVDRRLPANETQARDEDLDTGLDLPKGFKMTELGPLPEEWEEVRLGEVARFGGDRRTGSLDSAMIPFISMSLIPEDGLYITTWEMRRLSEIRSGILVREGDFLLAKITPCLENGKQGIVRGLPGGWGYATTEVIRIQPSSQLHVEYVALYLRQPAVREELAGKMEGTTGRQRLPRAVLESLAVPLPPLPEQRAIAHVLRTVQGAKEATERVIVALKELKKRLMRHLFTYGPVPVDQADQVPLKETEIGPVSDEWEVVRLGDVTQRAQYGFTATASQEPVGPKFLRITDIQDGRVNWALVPCCRIERKELEKYRLARGDLLFARIGATTGKSFLVSQCPQAVFASYLIRVRAKSARILPAFLWYITQGEGYWVQINAIKGGRLKQGINIPALTSLMLPLPPLLEQQRIAEILQAVDRKIEAEEARKRALEGLFKSLLHHLMTGKVRVKDLDVPDLKRTP